MLVSVMEMDTAQNNYSAFFLVTIARWKYEYVSISLQTVLGLLTVPWFLGWSISIKISEIFFLQACYADYSYEYE